MEPKMPCPGDARGESDHLTDAHWHCHESSDALVLIKAFWRLDAERLDGNAVESRREVGGASGGREVKRDVRRLVYCGAM